MYADAKPDLTTEWLERATLEHFGLAGTLSPLDGDRDRNVLLTGSDGTRWVVKVTNPEEDETHFLHECRLLAHLDAAGDVPVPRQRRTVTGDLVARVPAEDVALRVRVLSFLEGRPLASVRPRTEATLRAVGRATAHLSSALAAFPEPVPPREAFAWSLDEAGRVMEEGLAHLDGHRRDLVAGVLRTFRDAAEAVSRLSCQPIHGDLNDHNLLIRTADDGGTGPQVTGILDFGDAGEGPAVYDLAIAAAYGCLECRDPVAGAGWVAAGYHEVRPLTDEELEVLYPLILARLGASVSIAAGRRAAGGDVDPYHLVSEAPAWAALEALTSVHPRLGRALLRDTCGLEPVPAARALRAWMEGRSFAPVMDLRPEEATVLDLSVGSPLLTGRDTDDTPTFTRRVFDAMSGAGATAGIGRYDEPRGFYLTEAFAGRPGEQPERRTVHMGIDVFVEPGAAVQAFMDATVRSVRDNAGRLDYGPTVILEHEGPDGPFWSLYGHLERASVAGLSAGDRLEAGRPFARVGPPPENGDWPPHLHFQLVTDLMDTEGDFPGVALPRERRVWRALSPDPNLVLKLPLETTYHDPQGLEERRRRLLGPSLSLSYRRPIHVVRGMGAYLYDDLGRAYLDCVNNVAHVGHEHPRVVAAGQAQMAVLNTNTRYLHEAVLEYAEALLALFPDPLSVCFFVNSGSEANELALRMARAATGGRGVVAVEGGYHGNTQGLVDVSHYKFSGPGGGGPPPWVRAVPMPDPYRGRYRGETPRIAADPRPQTPAADPGPPPSPDGLGRRYASHVAAAAAELAEAGHPPAAFLCESILSCGGQIVPPEGYLAAAAAHAREAGAVYIADEVQVGFGRVGTHMWAFEEQGVVPDIVTLGKPIGNGHPLGAVVTTREIAEAFANGMEYFSTFGGNPVSARIGLAVLRVMEEEQLQARALEVGGRLQAGLEGLMASHPCVGNVRGRGLFLGVEFVANRETRTPDPAAAEYAVQRMRERGILLSTDGPDHNVIKIKPPLAFSPEAADRVVEELDEILSEDPVARRG